MSLQPPKIDKRSYDDLVAHTQKLAEYFTSIEVRATVEELQGQILAEDIKNENEIIATSGQFINEALAEKISNIQNLVRVKVKRWLPRSTEVSPKYLLGRTLAQDIKNGTELIATTGKVVDATLLEKIAKIQKLESVKVKPDKDTGWALIRIFGRMAALVSDRLNQVPNKNFLAFLDLIGTQLLPPQPAKVPLTFSLAEGSPVDAVVPAHTQVAAPPPEGQEEEVVFETDRELVVTTAQLQAVFVREPGKDKYSDCTLEATGKEYKAFEAFKGEQFSEHSLYLACDELFTLPGNKTVTLTFDSPKVTDLANLLINWSYWDGSKWQALKNTATKLEQGKLQVVISDLPALINRTINGQKAGWLRGSLSQPLPVLVSFLLKKIETDKDKEAKKLEVDKIRDFMVPGNFIRLASGASNQEDCKIIKVESTENKNTITVEEALKNTHLEGTSITLLWQSKLPNLNDISVTANIEQKNILPDLCFFNTVPLDLSKDFYPFGEQPRFNDTLYIASQEVFARPEAKVKVNVQLSNPLPSLINPSSDLEIEWEVWNGQNWESLKSLKNSSFSDKTQAFTQTENIEFTLLSNITSATVSGENNYWIRARIVKGNYGILASQVSTITILAEDSRASNNKTVLTVNSVRGFMPNDRIQIVSGGQNPKNGEIESIDNTKNTVTLKSLLNQTYPKGTSVILLSGSVFGPPSVKSLTLSYTYEASSSLSACCAYNDFHYVNLLTTALRKEAKSGQNILTLASVVGLDKGDRLWLGRREERTIEAVNLEQRTVTLETAVTLVHDPGTLVEFFTTLREEAKSGDEIFKLSSIKIFAVGDRLQINPSQNNWETYEIEGVDLSNQTVTVKQAIDRDYSKYAKVVRLFQPFTPSNDQYSALYLGFDKPFANRPTTLYAQVEPPQPNEVATELKTSDTEPVRLVWEYASPSGWSSLGAKDETNGFAQRGLIQFIGPTDFIKTNEFGKELYWLRVRHEQGEFRIPPRLRRILTNTIWATQVTTLEDETLGSSDGNPNQIFRTTQIPVLQGQKLEVREPQTPSAEEKTAIESLEGEDAIALIRDEAGQIEEVWVRWHEVPDFYASKPRDRHYVLDRFSGEVRFGDGQYGMVPPQGRQNIRLSFYQTGGGTRGNLPAKTVVQLKTTVPYVDSVTNLEAAGGGTEQESLEQVKERGPKFLRHRGRAVTVQDFEDLAYEASPDVARAKAIGPTFRKPPDQDKPLFDPLDPNLWLDPNAKTSNAGHDKVKALNAGQLRLLIVPRSAARQPVPSLALLDRVKSYIQARCPATVDLQVTGPNWQEVSVTATVVPVSLDVADATRAALVKRLEEFLHPLTGGKEGHGWVLGRLPHKSDLYAVIEAIKGVERVHSLVLKPDPEKQQLSPEQLVYSGTHTIELMLLKEEA